MTFTTLQLAILFVIAFWFTFGIVTLVLVVISRLISNVVRRAWRKR